MNIKDFLTENFIWIIVVIVLIIVTIIGFLVDKKKNNSKKKDDPEPVPNNNMGAPLGGVNQSAAPTLQTPLTYQQPNTFNMNNEPSIPIQPQNNEFVAQPINNMNMGMGQLGQQPMPQVNQMGVTQPMPGPVENINPVNETVPEPMYQPLSDQKPMFSSIVPEPINQVPTMNAVNMAPTPESINQPIVNNMEPVNPIPNVPPAPVAPTPVPTEPMGQTIPQPMPYPQPNQNMMPGDINQQVPGIAPTQPGGFVYGQQPNNNQM